MNFNNILGYIVSFATIGSVLFLAFQTRLLKKDYRIKNDKAEREKAIELSKFYIDEIIPLIGYFNIIYKQIGIDKILSDIEFSDMVNFDLPELKELLSNSDIQEIMERLNNIDISFLAEASNILRRVTYDEYRDYLELKVKNNKSEIKINTKKEIAATKETNNQVNKVISKMIDKEKCKFTESELRIEFENIKCNVLNKLEYFCMNFNSGIADEETVYQSLHQSFLAVVKLLYFDISSINDSGKNKYYTNIIRLFNEWSERYQEQQNLENTTQRWIVHEKKSLKK